MRTQQALRRTGLLGTVTALALAGAAVPASAADPAPDPLISITLDAGNLSVGAGDGVSDPSPVVPSAGSGTVGAVPDHPSFGFLGSAGRPVWALASPNSAFPSWDTAGVPADQVTGGISLELADVDGPGEFHAYTLSSVGVPQLLLGTSDEAPDRTILPAGTRGGGLIWVFDAPGDHELTVAASAQLAGGGTAEGEATYQVDVPEFDSSSGTADALSGAPALASDLQAGGLAPPPAAAGRNQALAQENDDSGEQVVIGDGHVDIGPRFVDDEWTIQVKDDTVSPLVWRDLADVVLQVVDEAAIEIPEGEFDFLGSPGDTVWVLPQAQQSGILWPGWNTEDASVVEGITGDTTWRLHQVTGPGEFVLFLTGSFGQSEILFNSRDGLPQETSIPLRTHAHGNWAFTESGVYHLEIEMSATTTDGDQVTDTRTLALAVGDVDPNTAFPGGDGNGNGDGGGDGNGDGNGNGNGNGNGDGDGSGNGNGNGDGDGSGGPMPKTGVAVTAIAGVAVALIAVGTVLLRRSRRTSSDIDDETAGA